LSAVDRCGREQGYKGKYGAVVS